ncbi:ATP-dependent dethiobiotin synthetase BioD [Prosthecochloris sp. ZM_2]|uniref:dethiobiotin synthase n=1 Tax=Prosthecochloris sp. ZM_2 TaxID=2045206 RepID=UPI000DF7E94E|nr:dethiobiotin synthase [Prosthecochloris sp. ZM_2]RNA65621.1 ATP-dependent dethiobiotin synthetase BioD [Prosthecochloris sp. ZM_2]
MVIAVSGIDTGVGKTVATGMMARALLQSGYRVMTQKMVQTGCSGIAEDVVEHRRLMGVGMQDVDHEGLTCPFVFGCPASPHLAAAIEGREVDPAVITRATRRLEERYEPVLLEGAGGLMVPLNKTTLLIDYLAQSRYPLVLVSSSRLGSINHTLLSLEACSARGIRVAALLYNRFSDASDTIAEDTRSVLEEAVRCQDGRSRVIDLPDASHGVTDRFRQEMAAVIDSLEQRNE